MTTDHAQRLALAFIDLTGGRLAWEWARLHYGEGESIRAIADLYGDDAPNPSTIHRHVTRVWDHAERHGLLPAGWTKQTQGGRRTITTHGTDAELYEGTTDRRRNGKSFLQVSSDAATPPAEG